MATCGQSPGPCLAVPQGHQQLGQLTGSKCRSPDPPGSALQGGAKSLQGKAKNCESQQKWGLCYYTPVPRERIK